MRDSWHVGSWQVNLREGWIAHRGKFPRRKVRLDARLMAVLAQLVDNAGETVSIDVLLAKAWPERVVGRDSVTTAIYQLRQLLGDSVDEPAYIVSEHRRGYRLIAPVAAAGALQLPRVAWQAVAAVALLGCASLFAWQPAERPLYVYVEPMQNYTDSPVEAPLFTAIESTLLGELIQSVPGRILADEQADAELRLQSMMVACDLGPTLVMRLLDTRNDTYVWSEIYNLDEQAAMPERPTLVERAARDVSAAIL